MKGFSLRFDFKNLHEEIFVEEGRYDNFVFENESLRIVFEGLLINKGELLKSFACSGLVELFQKLFYLRKSKFPEALDGEFRGYVREKAEKKLYLFTNHTATQRLFYYQKKELFFADSSLLRLAEKIQNHGIRLRPNLENIYQLPAFGNMLEDCTPIENVFKIKDGHLLILGEKGFKIEPYSNLPEPFKAGKKEAVEQLDSLFRGATAAEYSEDFDRKTVTFLSGGLDSRLALFAAMDAGFMPQKVLCFSQSGYWDEKISRKIAADFSLDFEFIPLDGGSFLSEIDELTAISEGTCHYTGGIHVQHALKQCSSPADIFHSGQIGDGILGGFNTVPKITLPSAGKILQRPEFLPHVEGFLAQTLQKYDREEYFYLRNIGFNRTVLGAQVLNQKELQLSPFMDRDFINLAMSLPPEWKFKQNFYIEWLIERFPKAAKYRWERSLMKPDAAWKTAFGDTVCTRFYKYANLLFGRGFAVTMTPYQYYFDHSVALQRAYTSYYSENLDRVDVFPELKADVQKLFASPDFYDKSMALNILSIFKLYF